MRNLLFLLALLSSTNIKAQERISLSSDLILIPLNENVWVHSSYFENPTYGRFSSNGLIFIQDDEAWLFDTPMADSLNVMLLYYLKDTLKLELKGFVPNHWHEDCTQGLSMITEMEVTSYANHLTNAILKENDLPLALNEFSDSVVYHLNGKPIVCIYPGKAHTSDNIVVWLPTEKILFAGCMVKSLNSKGLGNIADADLEEWPKTMAYLSQRFKSAEIVVPGHGNYGDLSLIHHTVDLLKRTHE